MLIISYYQFAIPAEAVSQSKSLSSRCLTPDIAITPTVIPVLDTGIQRLCLCFSIAGLRDPMVSMR